MTATLPLTAIDRLSATACRVPVDARAGCETDGTLAWDATTIVLVEASCGEASGWGYTYADAAVAAYVESTLAEAVQGTDALEPERAWWAMAARVRNDGRGGLTARALSAVDIALWDLKARVLGLPLYRLLGAVRERVAVYGSGGFCSYDDDELAEQVRGWRARGIDRMKMKVGRDPHDDERRVALVHRLAGDGVELMVDANGAWTVPQAVATASRWHAEHGIGWVEEPVSSDDRHGLRTIRERIPGGVSVAAGEYACTPDDVALLLDGPCVDVLQADATRCGGVTGMLNAAAQCVAAHVPLSAHTSPSVHAHLGCALAPLVHVEWFHDHVRIEQELFDGALPVDHGALAPDPQRPGLGLQPREEVVARWAR